METTKTCSKCGVVKLAGEFYSPGNQCKDCRKAASAKRYREVVAPSKPPPPAPKYANGADRKAAYVERNRERVRLTKKAWKLRNPLAVQSQNRRRYAERKEDPMHQARLQGKRKTQAAWDKENLPDRYVAKALMVARVGELPPELLEMKRSVIRARRIIRSIEKELKNERNHPNDQQTGRRAGQPDRRAG